MTDEIRDELPHAKVGGQPSHYFQVAAKCPTLRMRIALVVMLAAVTGCHNRRSYYIPPSTDGLRFDASAALAGPAFDTLAVRVRAVNTSTTHVRVEFDQCDKFSSVVVRASVSGRTWDSRTWELGRVQTVTDSAHRRVEEVCAGNILETIISPGRALMYDFRVGTSEVLGDSLGAGIYRIRAGIDINGRHVRNLKAGEIQIPFFEQPDTR